MNLYSLCERAMGMDGAVWRRHANPLSGWSRLALGLPLLTLVIWSRVWIGWWALPLVGVAMLWIWLNPRIFGEPEDFGSWMARGVQGEQMFLHHRAAVPSHHRRAAHLTTGIAALGALVWLWGLIVLDGSATLAGLALSMIGKLWFLDRMVWLHADLSDTTPGTSLAQPVTEPRDAGP